MDDLARPATTATTATAPSTAPTLETTTAAGPSIKRVRAAQIVAILADLLQVVLFPIFVEGALSPFDAVLDTVVAATMIWLLGWHWSFLPSFVAEALPGVDLVPTWTGAVLLATRSKAPPALPAAR